jgi:hypothetical protein
MNTIEASHVGHHLRTLRDDELDAVTGGADTLTTYTTLTNAFSQTIKSMGDGLQSAARAG